MIFSYKGKSYPEILKNGNAMQYILPIASQFCKGKGIDVGCGNWCLPGAEPWDISSGGPANNLPEKKYDYIFSSHCLEHVVDPVSAVEHWRDRLNPNGCLFLYLPHPDMEYWRPANNRKHLHILHPEDVAHMLRSLGFVNVLHSERDFYWSFVVVGFTGAMG